MTLLPTSATGLELTLERVASTPLDNPLRSLWSPQACPVDLLPYLAWALSVDVWDNAWPEYRKRSAIEESIAVHKLKGSVDAVRRALAPFGGVVELQEWWQSTPAGTPYTFTVNVIAADAVEDDVLDQIVSAIEQAKPVSRHWNLNVGLSASCELAIGGAVVLVSYVILKLEATN